MSLGRGFAGHSFAHRLDMAQEYGYKGIELFYEDLSDIANLLKNNSSAENELQAAAIIHQMCAQRGLVIICLQPFSGYEGLLDRSENIKRLEQLKFWFQLAKILGTDMVLIPSSFAPASQMTEDRDLIISDLQAVADLGLRENPPIRYVYEALCWGTRIDHWEQSWEVVQAVDRPNFGLCLDTFNIAGRIYADPASPTGKTVNAEQIVKESISRLLSTVDVCKVFYVQVVDAKRLEEPLVEGHKFYNAEQPCRMSWSRNCRLFYRETEYGAYLPVKEISKAIFQGLGFEGWVSLELFNRRMSENDKDVPRELASRGAISWAKLVRDMNLRVDRSQIQDMISASL